MGHGVKKKLSIKICLPDTVWSSLRSMPCGYITIYDHIWGVSANYRIRAINNEFCLAVNPCFVTGKKILKWKICQKSEILKLYLYFPLNLVQHLKG